MSQTAASRIWRALGLHVAETFKPSRGPLFAEEACDVVGLYISPPANENPWPFVWTKAADQIRASVARFCRRTSNSDQ